MSKNVIEFRTYRPTPKIRRLYPHHNKQPSCRFRRSNCYKEVFHCSRLSAFGRRSVPTDGMIAKCKQNGGEARLLREPSEWNRGGSRLRSG